MAARRTSRDGEKIRRRPATTPEQREQQLASLAYDTAEEQMRNGTASSQVITHFLKAGSRREQLEQLKLEHETELIKVKQEAMARADRMEELMGAAIDAMRSYSGHSSDDPIDDEG